jgi:hypothetical protein
MPGHSAESADPAPHYPKTPRPAKKMRRRVRPGVGVSKVGGIFVHKRVFGRFAEKFTFLVREAIMQEPRASEQEAATQQLTEELTQLVEDELRDMVRTLQEAEPATLFGQTEFKVRDLALRIATKAYQQRLAQKKTATKAPV